jgi:lpxtg cell wall surface protein, collagen binding domain protein
MKKVTLVTTLTLSLALLATANVKADETTTTSEPSTTVTSTQEPTSVETTADETTSVEPTSEAPVTTIETSVEQPSTSTSTAETLVTKTDKEITVTNPKVTVDQSDGAGKYNTFKVKYENITIPDEISVNEGDKVVLTLPKQVKFQTSFDFDVKNPTDDVVGKAHADSESGELTTVFNSYFQNHPLNKQMSLTFDAQWSNTVESGKPVSVNFNGTIVTANIAKEQEIGKDELISKWGGQDKDDPTVINWTLRVNYARRVLNVVKILDTMSDNQKLVDDFLEVKYVDSVDPWIEAGDAKELVKSMVKNKNGFELTLNRLERMVYVNYKTKLTNPVKDSVNPTNKVTLTSDDVTAGYEIAVSLVGGRGNAVGENKPEPTKPEKPVEPAKPNEPTKPKWELPNDAPVVEIPELDIKDIPMMPPAPVLEIPELPLEDIPLLPPAPILEKPYLPIEDIPMMPPAPILELPELKITEEPKETPTTPTSEKPVEKNDKPKGNTPVPTTPVPNTPVKNSSEQNTPVENTSMEKVETDVIQKQNSESTKTRPNTGESPSNILLTIGLTVTAIGLTILITLAFKLLRKN